MTYQIVADLPYDGLSAHSVEDVSIEVVAGLPPPPVINRNYKSTLSTKDGRTKAEGRIGSYIVDKRSTQAEDSRSSKGVDDISEIVNTVGKHANNLKGFSRDTPKGGRDGVRPGCGGDRKSGRNSDDSASSVKFASRSKVKEIKKDSALRFSNGLDKRSVNNSVHSSKQSKRVINSGKLVLEASYDELPECFHIGHNPESFYPPEIRRAIHNVQFIHTHMVQQDKFDEVRWKPHCTFFSITLFNPTISSLFTRNNFNFIFQNDDDWAFVAMVMDRLLLWIFGLISLVGTLLILLESPFLSDTTPPIDVKFSKVGIAHLGNGGHI